LFAELDLIQRHTREDSLRHHILKALQNEEHQVRGVVGRIVQREPHTLEEAKNMTDHQLNYEIMRIDNSAFKISKNCKMLKNVVKLCSLYTRL